MQPYAACIIYVIFKQLFGPNVLQVCCDWVSANCSDHSQWFSHAKPSKA